MFFTMTTAIGAAMTAAVWSIDDGLTVAGLAAGRPAWRAPPPPPW